MPDFAHECRHGADTGRIVIGLDEAGRGPWAGPVVAAAAWLRPSALPKSLIAGLDDSKKLTATARDRLHDEIVALTHRTPEPALAIAVGRAEVAEIDSLNILQASLLAMRRACDGLGPMLGAPVDMALIDGNRLPDLPCPAETVVKGDARSLSIAAASIVAKVVRDREMERLAEAFPGYGWERNRGYGTAEHQAALARLGVTPQHRRSFRPVRERIALNI